MQDFAFGETRLVGTVGPAKCQKCIAATPFHPPGKAASEGHARGKAALPKDECAPTPPSTFLLTPTRSR
jgi:hypothetical protein